MFIQEDQGVTLMYFFANNNNLKKWNIDSIIICIVGVSFILCLDVTTVGAA